MEEVHDTIRIVFYSSLADDHQTRVVTAVSKLVSEAQLNCHSTLEGVEQTLQGMPYGFGIVLILARSENELYGLVRLNALLKHYSIVLILTHNRTDLTRLGLKLYPRYIGYAKDDDADLFSVLKKMIDKMRDKRRAEWQRK
jgi:hypothetical protein